MHIYIARARRLYARFSRCSLFNSSVCERNIEGLRNRLMETDKLSPNTGVRANNTLQVTRPGLYARFSRCSSFSSSERGKQAGVCMYMYECICSCIYIYIYVYIYIYICLCIYTHMCVCPVT